MREYSRSQTVVANVPYAAMVLLGATTVAYGFGFSPWALAGAGSYLAYGVAGAFWIMVFICPYCAYYANRGCPCGYGMVSARLVKKGEQDCFTEKFRRHIPVIVPLWLIPLICALVALWHSYSWWLTGLVSAFAINSYVVLPLVSRQHSCADCPQKGGCPWMTKGAKLRDESVAQSRKGQDPVSDKQPRQNLT